MPISKLNEVVVGNNPQAVAYGDDSVWVVNQTANTLSRVDLITFTVTATITTSLNPQDVTYGASHVWVSTSSLDRVNKIDPTTNAV
ncbi:MAG: hypothetical protein ACO307_10615, partial [Ilumatobacteraceae bacterium]